jgi:hypothetical protein
MKFGLSLQNKTPLEGVENKALRRIFGYKRK